MTSNGSKLQGMGDDELRGEVRGSLRKVELGNDELEMEVWRRLPERFRLAYELVWLRAFGASIGGRYGGGVEQNVVASSKRVTRTSTSQVETRGGAHSGKKLAGASVRGVIGDEAALAQLRRMDRRLREIARQASVWLGTGVEGGGMVRRCSVCKQFGDGEWLYCPKDGKPMEDVDR